MDVEWPHLSLWSLLAIPFFYYTYELLVVRRLAHQPFPLIGNPSFLTPTSILNLFFAFKAERIINAGYQKFKNCAFQFIRNDGQAVVLPLDVIEELSSLPPSVASANEGLEHDLLGKYTGLDLILDSRMHHSIVQRKLTPRLGRLTPSLEQELVAALKDGFPACEVWTEIKPYQLLAKVSARLSARTLVGPTMSRDARWLDISVNYVENLILRLLPGFLQPILCYLLPSYWKCYTYIRYAKALLGPRIDSLLRKGEQESWTPDTNSEEHMNVLSWLADAAKGRDRNPDVLAHIEVLLALASVHTTLLRMVNVLYDLTANPIYVPQILAEIYHEKEQGWTSSSYSRLSKLDSILRESQRLSPPTTLGMKRLFKQPHTFQNGIHIPANTYICLPTFAIENDPEHTQNPSTFDGLRSWRLRQRHHTDSSSKEAMESEFHQFTSVEPTVLNFGYGKTACPGRFFAALVLKILFVKLLEDYEFRFLEGKGRPRNIQMHEFLFPWPWDRIEVRKRVESSSPF
ncbi:hypothetical protein ACLMJK_002824 [Lecanora helva]